MNLLVAQTPVLYVQVQIWTDTQKTHIGIPVNRQQAAIFLKYFLINKTTKYYCTIILFTLW